MEHGLSFSMVRMAVLCILKIRLNGLSYLGRVFSSL